MLNLPEPDRQQLARAPLQQVTLHLYFETDRGFPAATGVAWRKAIEKADPTAKQSTLKKARLQNMTINFQGTTPATTFSPGPEGWLVDAGTFTATVYPNAFVYEEKAYSNWADFECRAGSLLRALVKTSEPKVRYQVGLRFFNVLQDPNAHSPAFWRKKIRAPFLGFAENEALATVFKGSAAFASFNQAPYECQARTAIVEVPDQARSLFFVSIDLNLNETTYAEMSVDDVLTVLAVHNTTSLQLFQQIVEPKYLAKLRGNNDE